MKILIVTVGKKHDENISSFIEEFEKRLSRTVELSWHIIKAGEKDEEGEAICRVIKDTDRVFLLDERGENLSSSAFAKSIDDVRQDGSRLVFVIGGAYGVSDTVTTRANKIISLSKMVFPHMLVRALLVEQIYRAFGILSGSQYHHGD